MKTLTTLDDNIKRILSENATSLSTLNDDNSIHSIAVACIKAVDDTKLLITDNFMKVTKENIERNPNMTLLVWDGDWRDENCKAYEIKGRAEYFKDGKWREIVKKDADNEGLSRKGAILLNIELIKESV